MTIVLITTVRYFCNFIYILLFARVILSWVPSVHDNKIVKLLFALTEPILSPIRSLLNKTPLGGPGMILDFSPIIAFFLLSLVQNIILGLLSLI